MAAPVALIRRRGAVAASLSGLIGLGAVGGAWATHRALGTDRGQVTTTVAAAAGAVVAARIGSAASVLTTASRAMNGVPRAGDAAGAFVGLDPEGALGVARPTPQGPLVFTPAPSSSAPISGEMNGIDLGANPGWRLAFELARDGGQPVAAAGVTPRGTRAILQALALYGPGAAPSAVADRRTALTGYVVVLEPATALLGAVPSTGSRLSAQLDEGSTFLAGIGPKSSDAAPASAASVSVVVNGATWVVRAWSTRAPSRLPWLVLFTGLGLAVVGGAVVAAGEAETTKLAAAATARSNELSLVARTGSLLQQSLELGELLPLFVVEVSDELVLDGVVVSLVSDTGRLVRAFSLGGAGSTPAPDLAELAEPPATVPEGGYITVPLQRASRVVGVLGARARHGLDASQTETLRSVCDLLAAALGNAKLLQDEQAMVARLRDVDRLKTTFLGSVSHDLRTTVTAIEGFTSLLVAHADALDDGQRSDFLTRIQRNSRSLAVLVDDLLDFARLERSGLSVTLRPVDLSDLVPKVVDQMYSILGERPMTVVVGEGVVANADPGAMERILINLLSNAAKYTPPGTEVTVTIEPADGSAVLSVSDRGPGISPEERERIFDRFYRVDNETSNLARGVGIGLALVRQLVDLQHGSVRVDEAPGGGACFRVTVPLVHDRSLASPS